MGRLVNIELTKSKFRHILIVPVTYSFYKYLLRIYYRPRITVSPRNTEIFEPWGRVW